MAGPVPIASTNPLANSSFIPASVMLERDDLSQLLERGSERARVANAALIAEREAERMTFENAISRANRRTSEAQDRFSLAAYEHGDNMKLARAEFSETLKLKAREHTEALEKIRKQMQSELELQRANTESLVRQNEHLKKENDVFREGRPGREKDLEKENDNLNADVRALKERLEAMELEKKERAAKEASTQASSEVAASNPSTNSEIALNIQAIGRQSRDVSEVSGAALTQFSRLSAKIADLNHGLEELPMKTLAKSVQDLMEQKGLVESGLERWRQHSEHLNAMISSTQPHDAKDGPSNRDTIMQEAPRTPPADQPLPSKSEPKAETNGINNYPHLPSARVPLTEAGK